MDNAKVLEIREAAQQAAVDAVKAQIAKGAPGKGLDKARHVAVVAYVVNEISSAYCTTGDDDETKAVLRAAFSGSLLNASQLRQELEKAKVLEPAGKLDQQYDV